ncbi:MAG TPA: DVUA0089 family protein [Fimbriimonadaceae bacterium]|nr:DVUA0089 family protein [Fimbriimonadaceae bacterium]HRJ96271.1 DVUA0089 family protein [Fimbriimonadaceae bacterium]
MKRLLLLCLACTSTAAFSQVWNEVGDAIELPPGQLTVGVGPLTNIVGEIAATNDRDLYCIYIDDYLNFRATTVNQPGTLADTQLFLFDANAMGVTYNDDDPGGGTLRSTLTSVFVPGNGFYMIAISGYNGDPVGPTGALIWNNTPFNTERAPDGPGAPGPLSGWTGTSGTGTYDIWLRGATFCAVPEPGTLAALGLGALALLRRRRKA